MKKNHAGKGLGASSPLVVLTTTGTSFSGAGQLCTPDGSTPDFSLGQEIPTDGIVIVQDGTCKKVMRYLSRDLTKAQRNRIITLVYRLNEEGDHRDDIKAEIQDLSRGFGLVITDEKLRKVSRLFGIEIPEVCLAEDQKDMILNRVNWLKKQGVSLEEIRGEIQGLLCNFGVDALGGQCDLPVILPPIGVVT